MNAVLLESPSIQNMKLLLELVEKLGIKSRELNAEELEDFALANDIEKGMLTDTISKEAVMEALQTQ